MRDTTRYTLFGATAISIVVGLAAIFVVPAAVMAQCNYGSCAIPPGYCVIGSCNNRYTAVTYYFDLDCGGTICEEDKCDFYERLSDNSCPTNQFGAICYSSDIHFCNGDTCSPIDQFNCGNYGGTWDDDDCTCYMSPILINLQNDGQDHLTSAVEGVAFDLNADGSRDKVAWTRADSRVGFLALDNNGNGKIDDGSELFGTATRKRDGTLAANGFVALQEFDDNGDGRIDSRDTIYPRLRLWLDKNHNGRSEPSELFSLPTVGVEAILTSYKETKRHDQYGNEYRFAGKALLTQSGGLVERRIFDVFLATLR